MGPSLSYGLLVSLCQAVLLTCLPFMVWKTYIILFYFPHMSHLLLIFIIMIYEHNILYCACLARIALLGCQCALFIKQPFGGADPLSAFLLHFWTFAYFLSFRIFLVMYNYIIS